MSDPELTFPPVRRSACAWSELPVARALGRPVADASPMRTRPRCGARVCAGWPHGAAAVVVAACRPDRRARNGWFAVDAVAARCRLAGARAGAGIAVARADATHRRARGQCRSRSTRRAELALVDVALQSGLRRQAPNKSALRAAVEAAQRTAGCAVNVRQHHVEISRI